MRIRNLIACPVIAVAMMTAAPASSADFYDGQTITLITNVGAGGATDVQARLFAEHWKGHIKGNPNFVIDPMPGGGMLLGINYLMGSADPDGLTLGFIAPSVTTRPLGPEAQRVAYEKFEVVGSVNLPVIAYARKNIGGGLKEPADIAKAGEITVAGFQPRSAFDMNSLIGLDLLGIKTRYVAGFGGGSALMAALLRGEADLGTTGLNSYRVGIMENFIEPGHGIGLWTIPPIDEDGNPVDDPNVTDAPPFHKLYEQIKGEAPSGPAYDALMYINNGPTLMVVAPPGTPEDLVTQLRDSFMETTQDPEYLADVEKQVHITPVFFSAKRSMQMIDRARSLTESEPETAKYLSDIIAKYSE